MQLLDQFDRSDGIVEEVQVGRVLRFCNPVEKTRLNPNGTTEFTPIQDRGAHLKLYEIAPVGTTTPFQPRRVIVSNQFGVEELDVIQPLFLAVPTQKLAVDLDPDDGVPPEPTGLGAPLALDHFKCYEVQPQQPVGVAVDLKDQFLQENVDVIHAALLCNPVQKIHAGEVTEPRSLIDHLVCYRITENPFPARVVADNQFGPETLDILDASLLCVPSQKRVPPPPPLPLGLDHFRCYPATTTAGTIADPSVGLNDQFGPSQALVLDGIAFCNPVVKQHGPATSTPLEDPNAHIRFYRLATTTPSAPLGVVVNNQFGGQTLQVGPAVVLAVPTQKLSVNGTSTGLGFPATLDHFKCYGVDGQALNTPVGLTDQFLAEQTQVLNPFLLCNPTEKQHGAATPTPVLNKAAHLVCYFIPPTQFQARVDTFNQFGPETIQLVPEPGALCVPSTKSIIGDGGPGPGPGPTPLGLDHFRCYLTDEGGFIPHPFVRLEDQFGVQTTTVIRVIEFCNPVEKTRLNPDGQEITPIQDPNAHLKWYALATTTAPFGPGLVSVNNQFGIQSLQVGPPAALAVPTQKLSVNASSTGLGFPAALDHFKCYDVIVDPAGGSFQGPPGVVHEVHLRDQFQDEQTQVLILS